VAVKKRDEEREEGAMVRTEERGRQAEGLRKAAILLIALDEDVAAEVLGQLGEEEAKLLSREILNLGLVDKSQVAKVVREFQKLINLSEFIKAGGAEHAFNLLKKSFPPDVANQIIRMLSKDRLDLPFDFLKKLEIETLLPFIQNEHPQTIAVILSHLEPAQAAGILSKLPQESQSDIVRRIAMLDHTSPEAIKHVERGLQKSLSSMAFEEFQEVGGVKSCAEILNVLDRTLQSDILDNLDQDNTDITEEIRKLMFVFEDILRVDDRGVQGVLKEVENKTLALALKGASEALQGKILSNMSSRAADAIREEISFLGPVRVADVQAAQQSIVDIVRRLEDAGEVIIAGRGGEGAMIE
jgi:flagellar motor switch protein FliG